MQLVMTYKLSDFCSFAVREIAIDNLDYLVMLKGYGYALCGEQPKELRVPKAKFIG